MTVQAGDRDLELSRVFALTMQALLRRPVAALLLAAPTIYLPNLWFARITPPEGFFNLAFAGYLLASIAVWSVSAVFAAWMVLQYVGAAQQPLVEAMKRAPSLYVTSFIITLVAILGVFALFVPGLWWALATAVAVPAAAVERLGLAGAIERSFELTENRRWAIFGFTLAILIPPTLAISLFEIALNDWQFSPVAENPVIINVTRPITDSLQGMLGAAIGAALYVELVRLPPLSVAAADAP